MDAELKFYCDMITLMPKNKRTELTRFRDQRCAELNRECVDDQPIDRNIRLWRAVLAAQIHDFHKAITPLYTHTEDFEELCTLACYYVNYVRRKMKEHRQSGAWERPLNDIVHDFMQGVSNEEYT